MTHSSENARLTREQAVAAGLLTSCREEIENGRCNAPAEFVLWGKLLAPEALGPRCYDHAVGWIGHDMPHRVDQYAVIDLRPLRASMAAPICTDSRAWMAGDGDSRCQECGHTYAPWFTDNTLWNEVMGGSAYEGDPGGCLCPRCFALKADGVFAGIVWRVIPAWSGRAEPMDFPIADSRIRPAAPSEEPVKHWCLKTNGDTCPMPCANGCDDERSDA